MTNQNQNQSDAYIWWHGLLATTRPGGADILLASYRKPHNGAYRLILTPTLERLMTEQEAAALWDRGDEFKRVAELRAFVNRLADRGGFTVLPPAETKQRIAAILRAASGKSVNAG